MVIWAWPLARIVLLKYGITRIIMLQVQRCLLSLAGELMEKLYCLTLLTSLCCDNNKSGFYTLIDAFYLP